MKIDNQSNVGQQIERKYFLRPIKELNGIAFKLWTILYLHDEPHFELKFREVEEFYGIKRTSYYGAINELIEKQYLLPQSDGTYYFQL